MSIFVKNCMLAEIFGVITIVRNSFETILNYVLKVPKDWILVHVIGGHLALKVQRCLTGGHAPQRVAPWEISSFLVELAVPV